MAAEKPGKGPRKPKTVRGVFPSNGRFRTDVSLGTDPATGKRRRVSIYGDTVAEVEAERDKVLERHARGVPVDAAKQTVEQYLVWWLETAVRGSASPRTLVSYEATVRLHILPTLGRTRLIRLTAQQVGALLASRAAAKGEDGRPLLGARSVQYIRTVLRIALNHAVKLGLVATNVATLVDGPRVPRFRIEPFTADQARALLKAAAGDRLEALYWVALIGLRQGEVLGLRWRDLDLEGAVLTVRHQLQRIDHALRLVEPKTEASRAAVSLPAAVVDALRAHRDRQGFERRAKGDAWQEGDFVFTTPLGTPIDARGIIRHYKALLTRAKLPERRFHDLRHSTATLLYAQGVELLTIKEVLRHTQLSTTADIYTHVMPEIKRAAASAMDDVLRGGKGRADGS